MQLPLEITCHIQLLVVALGYDYTINGRMSYAINWFHWYVSGVVVCAALSMPTVGIRRCSTRHGMCVFVNRDTKLWLSVRR